MENGKWLERDEAVLAGVLPRCFNVVASHGQGSWLWDVDGNKFLDFTSGIAVTNTGHCHPLVVEAIKEQASKLIHTSVTTHNILNIQLAERIGELCPFFNEPQVFFTNSGAEAVDGSLKLARRVTGRSGIVAFQHAFHGRTVAATSLTTAKEKYWKGYEPLLPGVFVAESLEDVENFLMETGWIGAVIVEPVLGEGGYIVPPAGWLQELRDICDYYDKLLIFDEVQTGIGRTGNMWAAETFGVAPDVILFAKGIASGLPLGGIIANRSLMDKWPTGTHGNTFGGNPISCASALVTLDIIEPLLPRVRERGEQILNRLKKTGFPVRGIGYMIGIELENDLAANYVKSLCQKDGLLIISCGPNDNVIRLIPPLNISDPDLEWGINILERALRMIHP